MQGKVRTAISFVLLLVFLYPIVLKGVHRHDITHIEKGKGFCNLSPEQEVCNIYQFEYLTFIVADIGHLPGLFSVYYKQYIAETSSLKAIPLFFVYKRGPPSF